MPYDPQDPYFKKAKKDGYLARSVYKLEEIAAKYRFFDKASYVLDIGCAPGSRSQYVLRNNKHLQLLGVDIKDVSLTDDRFSFLCHDATDREVIGDRIESHSIERFDVIISDMAPNTIGYKDVDAMRSMVLIEKTLYLYEQYLAQGGKSITKLFMGPGFEEFVRDFKKMFGGKGVKIMRPKAIRKESKECYLVKFA